MIRFSNSLISYIIEYAIPNKGKMKKKRILMVLATTDIGGAEMYVLNLLRNMDLSKYQVDFAVSFKEKKAGISNDLKRLGCEIYYLPYFKVYNYFQYVKAWDAFLSEHHYDIVHGHSTNSASVYLRVAKKHGCATIAHCHHAGYRGDILQKAAKAFFASGVTRVADYWFACSDKAAEHLYGKKYLTYKNYYNIPNAINAENYLFSKGKRDKIRAELNLSDDVLLCGHVGTLTSPKNHTFLLDIFASVVAKKTNAMLLLCGDGPLREEIEKKAISLGLRDKVILKGVVRNVNEYMMAMDVLVFPSIFEGFPITVIEAESTGLPIVLSDVITTEVDICEGIYRQSLSQVPDEWAQTICSITSGDRIKNNAVVFNSKYNMKTAAKLVMDIYDRMVSNTCVQ